MRNNTLGLKENQFNLYNEYWGSDQYQTRLTLCMSLPCAQYSCLLQEVPCIDYNFTKPSEYSTQTFWLYNRAQTFAYGAISTCGCNVCCNNIRHFAYPGRWLAAWLQKLWQPGWEWNLPGILFCVRRRSHQDNYGEISPLHITYSLKDVVLFVFNCLHGRLGSN